MLDNKEIDELLFFAAKVADVHGPEHSEFIEVNEIVKSLDFTKLDNFKIEELKKLTNNFEIPEWACNAQTRLLNLLNML